MEDLNSIILDYFIVSENDKVLTVKLSRPQKKNAFTPGMISELNWLLNYANEKSEIWIICLEASGNVFCAGMDLKSFQNREYEKLNSGVELVDLPLGKVMRKSIKPIIAKVNGPVLAGGFLLINECHFVIASDKAWFQLPETGIGLFPFQVYESLERLIGKRKALELCILGQKITAQEAKEINLINEVYNEEELEIQGNIWIEKIKSNAPLAISKGIQAINELENTGNSETQEVLKRELEMLRKSQDAQEGIEAFFEKRNPNWTNS